MLVLHGRNVNSLWLDGVHLINEHGVKAKSRAGDVLVHPTPVTSVYHAPCERVLMCHVRDANPFFHLMESLWMLAGRSDAKFLNHYVKDFGDRFAEMPQLPGAAYIHGAYGQRWRDLGDGPDQLDICIAKLRANPDDRQAVIQMWDAIDHDDLTGEWRDRPCNTHIYLRVRDAHLDLTVCCRSNDIIWGAYGANAVHFSMLQEYLAGCIGVKVGKMYQVSNNYHAYTEVLGKFDGVRHTDPYNEFSRTPLMPEPIGTDFERWDYDLDQFMAWHEFFLWGDDDDVERPVFVNSWFTTTAVNVASANYFWKKGNKDTALAIARDISAPDWRAACVAWMERRMK